MPQRCAPQNCVWVLLLCLSSPADSVPKQVSALLCATQCWSSFSPNRLSTVQGSALSPLGLTLNVLRIWLMEGLGPQSCWHSWCLLKTNSCCFFSLTLRFSRSLATTFLSDPLSAFIPSWTCPLLGGQLSRSEAVALSVTQVTCSHWGGLRCSHTCQSLCDHLLFVRTLKFPMSSHYFSTVTRLVW